MFTEARRIITELGWQDYVDWTRLERAVQEQNGIPADITLGETYGTHGHVIALVAGEPGTVAGQETPPDAYRFTYELR